MDTQPRSVLFLASCLAFAGAVATPAHTAHATDDVDLPSVEDLNVHPQVFLLPETRKKDCVRTGSVCLFGDGGGTVAGIDIDPTVGIVTTLARGTQVAGMAATEPAPELGRWHVEMAVRLRSRSASAEPILVAVLDYADPEGMARKEAVAVWQIEGASTRDLGMRLLLSAEDGFMPRHTYLVRMVQGTGVKEKVLAEGNFRLE